MDGYDLAMICLNGHVANPASRQYPEPDKQFCKHCGERLIERCGHCGAEIKGIYVNINPFYNRLSAESYRPPSFCESCGKPYPWIERRLQAAKELIDQEQRLAPDEKAALETDIQDVTHDVPRTQAAAIRIKNVLAKVPGALGSALRDIIVNFASEAAKKTILGP
jgi:hypothetical protein